MESEATIKDILNYFRVPLEDRLWTGFHHDWFIYNDTKFYKAFITDLEEALGDLNDLDRNGLGKHFLSMKYEQFKASRP